MNRLTKWCEPLQEWQENHDNDEKKGWKNGNRACMAKLAEYENTEERGLLMHLVCKVGDTVYTIYDNGEDDPQIETRKIFEVSTARIWLDSDRYCFPYDYFNKIVFFTRVAAENALTERKIKNGKK